MTPTELSTRLSEIAARAEAAEKSKTVPAQPLWTDVRLLLQHIQELQTRVGELEGVISDGLAGGSYGSRNGKRGECRCLWHEAARAVLEGRKP